MTGGSDVNVPPPSEEERLLQSEQAALLRQQRDILQQQLDQQNLLSPILFQQAGLEPEFNDQGDIVGFSQIEDPNEEARRELETRFLQRSLEQFEEEDPFLDRRREIEEGFLDRVLAAQRGELPVAPGLLRDLEEQEEVLRERLRRQLGPGFETSTPGIEALANFQQRQAELLEGARRGDLTLAEQGVIRREQANQARLGDLLGISGSLDQLSESRINSFLQRAAGTSNLRNPAGLGNLATGFGQAQQPFQFQRQMQFQAAVQEAQNRASGISSLFGGLGSGVGTFAALKFAAL